MTADAHAPDGPPLTVASALAAARALGLDRLDAQLLLAAALGRPRSWLPAHPEAPLEPPIATRYLADSARRADGVPVAYLLGHREFHGLDFRITPDVLDPRPDTETLVDWALECLSSPGPLAGRDRPVVLDLGTGSGVIAVSIQHDCPRACVTGIDASTAALEVAQDNGARLAPAVRFRRGDWLAGVEPHSVDLIVSNPPYLADQDPHWPGLHHEPRQALAAGPDGLSDLRRIAAAAPGCLRPGGWLLLEHGADQGAAVRTLLQKAGLVQVQTRQDLAGHERCSGAAIPTSTGGPSPDSTTT